MQSFAGMQGTIRMEKAYVAVERLLNLHIMATDPPESVKSLARMVEAMMSSPTF